MKIRVCSLFLVAALALTSGSAASVPTVQQERVAASFILALGRAPTLDEASHWAGADASVSDLIARHRQQLASDAAAQRTVARKALADSFGRAPGVEDAGTSAKGTYTELMQENVRWLAANPDEYAKVLNRAYQLVIRRDMYPEELEYWKKKDVQSFAVLVGCIDNWGRRNQPGLMVTAGPAALSINSVYLTTVRLSPAVAVEARIAAGLAAPVDAAAGTHVLAAGAEKIISDGRIHFAAALKD
jgi:hypothetical protein